MALRSSFDVAANSAVEAMRGFLSGLEKTIDACFHAAAKIVHVESEYLVVLDHTLPPYH